MARGEKNLTKAVSYNQYKGYFHTVTFESYNTYFNGSVANIGGPSEIIKQALPLRAIKEDGSVGSLVVTVRTDQATI